LNHSSRDEDADAIRRAESLHFDFGTIRVATDNFSEANKLGQGGFGSVYRVWIHHYINMSKNINYESN
jgi:hypothetical protein